jgi:hypothetical protein
VAFPRKLHWLGHSSRYECDDLAADPRERAPLPLARCASLFPSLDRAFGARPRPAVDVAPREAGD